jgi:hypothetical protein
VAALRLIFTRSADPGSLAIRAQAWGGPWSHCGIVDGQWVIEARWLAGGVVATPLADLIERSSRHAMLDVWCPRPDLGMAWARAMVAPPGEPPRVKYDHKALLGIVVRDRSLDDPARLYCSQHVLDGLAVSHLDLYDTLHHGVSPTGAWDRCWASNAAASAAGMRWGEAL